jgi:hypothetical protein
MVTGCDDKKADSESKDAKADEEAKGETKKASAPKKPPGPPIKGGTKKIKEIREDFIDSHAAAKAKYVGRTARLAGRVSMTIGKTFRINDTGIAKRGYVDILCRANDEKAVDGLKEKDIVIIKGTITGTVGDIKGANIEMSPCSIVEVK